MKILVFGLGYVGLANGVLLAGSNEVTGIDVDPIKVDMINKKKSPLQDEMIITYLKEKELNLKATTSPEGLLRDSDLAIVAVPTNYDEDTRYFDTSFVDGVIENIKKENKDLPILIKSTIPVGYTKSQNEKYKSDNIIFTRISKRRQCP